MMFKVGDKVKIPYICDCCEHNNQVGTITWIHSYNYYPNRDESVVEHRFQGTITYDDGTTEGFSSLTKLVKVA